VALNLWRKELTAGFWEKTQLQPFSRYGILQRVNNNEDKEIAGGRIGF
jgi:hypothetical protein